MHKNAEESLKLWNKEYIKYHHKNPYNIEINKYIKKTKELNIQHKSMEYVIHNANTSQFII